MTCSKCGFHIPEGAQTCPNCQTPVRQPGFLARLLGRLASARPPVTLRLVVRKTEFKDHQFQNVGATGQEQVYHSLAEIPPELRSSVEEALRAAESDAKPTPKVRITVKDASGQERTYDSVEDLPPDIRALYERTRESRQS